jgi:outer membrane receptor protein involved in Fe transport
LPSTFAPQFIYMRKFFVLLLLGCISSQSFSQMQGGQMRGNGQAPAGRFYGKVVDVANKGLEAVSVTLVATKMDSATKKPKETIIGGMLTSAVGDFSIENVPVFGKYKLKITGIGFKELVLPVAFEMPNKNSMGNDPSAMLGALDKDLGNIKMQIDENVLGSVTVTASKPLLQMGIDRKIFNVDKNITSAGGTAVDVMKNVPSVNVDIDGNVTLRNNAPQIFVDGRPTNLTLEQIPADAIESVEIITNPSAKFDASGGTAGILNIVMKKNRRVGYSGNVRINADSRGRVGGGADINLRQNKINIFGSGNLFQRKSISTGFTDRTNFGMNDSSTHFTQNDNSGGTGQFRFGRAGIDYFIDNRNTFTVSGTLMKGKMSPNQTSDINIDSIANNMGYGSSYQHRVSNTDYTFNNSRAQLSYKHNFPQTGHELTADATYDKGKSTSENNTNTNYYGMPGNVFDKTYQQIQLGGGNNESWVLQTDYANPISTNSKLELGARASLRQSNNFNQFYTKTFNGELKPTSLNTIYNNKDNVYAAYATFSSRIKSFGYQLGLRAERSDYTGDIPTKNQTFKINFPISFFPSMFLSQKLTETDEMQFNYSRRINRPNVFQLFPFIDSSDLLNVSVGNPALQPEFTNSFELSYSKTFKNRDNFIASAYFKNTNDLITRFQKIDTSISKYGVVNTYINANRMYITGLELTSRNKITNWWDLTSNVNLFTAKVSIDNQQSPEQFPSYFVKLNNNFKLPKNFSFQLSGDYQSKIISSPGGGGRGFGGGGMFGGNNTASQGYIRPNYGVDAAVKFDFLKDKKASLSLNVNDILRTRKYDAHSESTFFIQDIVRRRDPQIFRLNFNYRFGKFDASLFKRKNTKAENNVDMGNMNM